MINFDNWENISDNYWYLNYYNNKIYLVKFDINNINKIVYFELKKDTFFIVTNIFIQRNKIGENFIINNALYNNDCYYYICNNDKLIFDNFNYNNFTKFCKIPENMKPRIKKLLYNNN